ncbi:MAG: hypothetical protein ISS49_14345 [Anaerolineae bacterium]|nr:hypothetical protein [Anaerolineae bacterium]
MTVNRQGDFCGTADIDIQPDGSMVVAETYQIRFEGEFHIGFTEIPFDYVTDVVDVQVRENDRVYSEGGSGPGTFTVDHEWDAIYVEWEYEPTNGAEVGADLSLDGLTSNLGRSLDRASRSLGSLLDAAVGVAAAVPAVGAPAGATAPRGPAAAVADGGSGRHSGAGKRDISCYQAM